LYDYQDEGADFLYESDRAIILASVGAGKTAMTLVAIQDMIQDSVARKWLVVAPKRVCEEVWPVEREIWTPKLSMAVAVGTPAQRNKALRAGKDITVINYDNIQKLPDNLRFDAIVFDELTKLKNPSGKRFKAIFNKIQDIQIRWGLTGSFTSNGLEDVFGQCKIIDQSILGRAKGAYMQQYFICINREYGQYVPIAGSLAKVMDRIKPIAFLLDNKEYKDKLPPLHPVKVKVRLDDRVPYERMKKDLVTEVAGEQITALTAAAMTQKLQQLASGFAYTSDIFPQSTEFTKKAVWHSYHKFEKLDEIIEENQHAPTLVFYNFIEELEELKRRYPHLQTLDSPNAVSRFNEGKIELLAAHPKSAGHGLNLQGCAHHMVFLSLPWSFELYEQAVGRLHRGGQKREVWCYCLMTENTIDERIWSVLHDKKALAEATIDELRGK